MMKTLRIALWVSVFLLGTYLAYTVMISMMQSGQSGGYGRANIGGPFQAVRADGSAITQQDMIGKPHLIFFGFTHCPDVCPTTLYETSQWLKALGPDGDKLGAYFVTVDPERDTPEILNDYLAAFDPRITGISGSPDQIDDLVRQWRVFAKKGPVEDGEYNVDHTATTFLMNGDGSFFGTIAYQENAETAVQKLKRLIAAQEKTG